LSNVVGIHRDIKQHTVMMLML